MNRRHDQETGRFSNSSRSPQEPLPDRSVAEVFSERSSRSYEDNYVGNATDPNSFLKQRRKDLILGLAGNGRDIALELGSGPAVLTEALAALGKSVVALDISLDMVLADRARIKQGAEGITFCTGRCQGFRSGHNHSTRFSRRGSSSTCRIWKVVPDPCTSGADSEKLDGKFRSPITTPSFSSHWT